MIAIMITKIIIMMIIDNNDKKKTSKGRITSVFFSWAKQSSCNADSAKPNGKRIKKTIKNSEIQDFITLSENIKEFYTNHNIEDNNIILGDFNFCHRVIDRNVTLHRYDKIWCQPWENFCSDMNLVDPYRLQYPKRRLLFRIKSRKK